LLEKYLEKKGIPCTYVVALLKTSLLAEQLIELVALVMITTETENVRNWHSSNK
jgi:hypothetical protein